MSVHMWLGRRTSVVGATRLILAASVVWLCSCSQQAPAPEGGQKGSASAPKWADSQFILSNAGVYLMAVGPKETIRRPGQDVWKSLLTGMATDAGAKALISRLYNGLPTDFVLLPDQAAKDRDALDRAGGPPGAGFSVVLRVAGEQPLREVPGGDLFGSVGCRRDMRIKHGDKSADFKEQSGTRPPNDFAIILFAMNDHLLRTKTGYFVFDGGPSTPQGIRLSGEFPTHDLEAMRADLDRRIEKYLGGYGAAPQ